MTVTIEINGSARPLSRNYESWISEEIRNRRKAGMQIVVWVRIGGDIDLSFVTEDCPKAGGGGGRPYTVRQKEIIDLWCESGASESPVRPGNLISFLKRLERRLALAA